MTSETGQKFTYLACFVIISLAVTGYFIGLQSPMNPVEAMFKDRAIKFQAEGSDADLGSNASEITPATSYAGMGELTRQRSSVWKTSLVDLKPEIDPMAEVIVTPEQKAFALARREQNRAFNGAPPTVPHPIDQMSTQSCLSCHGEGIKTQSLRISKMSHQFLTNCTQCHTESNPQHMPSKLFRENSFVGLPAPTGGSRAYEGAPPMIPHSTWMRVDCMSCHGFNGLEGIRSTHPWRTDCQQCHAPSARLDQTEVDPDPKFILSPTIKK